MTRFAIILTGHIRTWEKCKDSLITNIIEPNYPIIPDIFVRTYDIKNTNSETYYSEEEIKEMMVFKLKTGERIEPKSIEILKNAEYTEEITQEMIPIQGDVPWLGTFNLLCKVKNIYFAYETLKQYEAQNGFSYDVFMFSRFDLIYSGPVFVKDITEELTLYLHYTYVPDPADEAPVCLRKSAELYVSRYPELFKSRYEHIYIGRLPSNDGHLLLKYVLLKSGLPDWSWNNKYFASKCLA